jgi:primosomal protein N' (replication factor Y)
MSRFADLILPLALRQRYTYAVPEALVGSVVPGVRVEVQFGRSRHYAAVVAAVHDEPPPYSTKPVLSVLDERPVLSDVCLRFWPWVAEYYCCAEGEVLLAALPAGLKLSSDTRITLSPFFDKDDESLSPKERLATDALLVQQTLSVADLQKILNAKSVLPLLKRLLDKRLVYLHEEMREKYRPRTEWFVRWAEAYRAPGAAREAFERIDQRAGRQLEALMAFVTLSRGAEEVPLRRVCETAEVDSAVVKKLGEKGILEVYKKEVSRLGLDELPVEGAASALSDGQVEALRQLRASFSEKTTVLLHGVTGSGKTQLYLDLMEEMMAAGKQTLYLVPEIALTAQLVSRLRKRFGNQVLAYHSKLNDQERVEAWRAVLEGAPLVLGARSALFLPFRDLGLIVVDEEHDPSFKQQQPAPRYHARDAATVLARLHDARVVLGSATPSLESWHNAQTGKYGLVTLDQRFGGIEMPEMQLVDLRDEAKRKRLKSHFSTVLLEAIQSALEQREQVILFQNRRGYSPLYKCMTCEWHAPCQHCDVSLTYHKFAGHLRCHYCGFEQVPPQTCPACGNTSLQVAGFGTEKIEDDLAIFFPEARIARMDLDTVRGKYDHDKLIQRFENQEIDILVGTQMVTKGLDFDHVAVVGVLSADQLLRFPDFRSSERTWQLITQVGGRAGRRQKRGKVIVQAWNVEHPVLQEVLAQQFDAFTERELAERRAFLYPPFTRLIGLQIKHQQKKVADQAARFLANWLRKALGQRVLGPSEPVVPRVRDQFLVDILLKLERRSDVFELARRSIDEGIVALSSQPVIKSARVSVDVDRG